VTSEPATARFTPVVTVEPPGPARTSNGGELSPPQQKEQ
jgi:hypothetical protein